MHKKDCSDLVVQPRGPLPIFNVVVLEEEIADKKSEKSKEQRNVKHLGIHAITT